MKESLEHFIPPPALPHPADQLRGEDLCALCADKGLSCCRADPAEAALSFPLSAPEWRRLRPYAALAGDLSPEISQEISTAGARPAKAFRPLEKGWPASAASPPPEGDAVCAAEKNSPEFFQAMLRLFPGEKVLLKQLFPADQRHFRLRLRPDGSCVFQGAKGCRLPRGVRPWYCRLFPAWVRGRTADLFQSESCLIARRAVSPAQGLELLSTTAGETRRLYEALREDWGLSPRKPAQNPPCA
jgi:Fe-S-cluster containining protein